MDALRNYLTDNPNSRYIIAGLVTTAATVYAVKKFTPKFGRSGEPKVPCPPGSVLLVQIGRGPFAPSMSPFPLKLETYLRMADIPYVTDTTGIMSAKGKTPWIIYEGERVADSQFSMEYLNKKFSKDLNEHLSKQDRASAEALRIMIDEHLYWTLVYYRWVEDPEFAMVRMAFKFPKLLMNYIKKKVKEQLFCQGIGRHTPEEIMHILKSDLQVISDYLGEKQFLTGDIPCEVDCSAFGFLAQMMWQDLNPKTKNILKEEFPSLVRYCERMREKFWPDWNDCITHGGMRDATK